MSAGAAFRGRQEVHGFIVDRPLIGETVARERVLGAWSPGARLHQLPDGRWLVLLAAPVPVRAERAPGVVVGEQHGALFAGGAGPGTTGVLNELRHGELRVETLSDLSEIDPSSWLELGDLEVVALAPMDAPRQAAAVEVDAAVEDPDLGARANLMRTARSELARREFELAVEAASQDRAGDKVRGFFAGMLLESPAAGLIGRRHRRYLYKLTEAFERGEFDAALRGAISLGGSGSSRLAVRLPTPRRGRLSPSTRISRGGGEVPWGATVHQHLTDLYRRAAQQLERDGKIEQAAFVHADLLARPVDAAMLLERHGRFELAAQLAEGRKLEPSLAVRLWWRAGDRRRAIRIARARGAWETAIERLEETEPEDARALRAEWLDVARRASDHALAVRIAWPDEALRQTVEDDLAALTSRGGSTAARANVRRLALRADGALCAEVARVLASAEAEHVPLRAAVLAELDEVELLDPSHDRRVATAGLRALLRDAPVPGSVPAGKPRDRLRHRLRGRADPILRADLPSALPSPSRSTVPLVIAEAGGGGGELFDAVAVDRGVLVALGERGVRLLGLDGQVLQRWNTPAHALLVADHGDAAVILRHGEAVVDVHQLALPTGRLRRLATLDDVIPVASPDGTELIVVDRDGIAGIDLSDGPRELWRELDRNASVLAIRTSATAMAALVVVPMQGRADVPSHELWTWAMPSRRLTMRDLMDDPWPQGATVTASGTVIWFEHEDDETYETRRHREVEGTHAAPEGASVLVDGDIEGLVDPLDGRVTLREAKAPIAVVEFGGGSAVALRVNGTVATLFTGDGRVVAIDLATRRTLVNRVVV